MLALGLVYIHLAAVAEALSTPADPSTPVNPSVPGTPVSPLLGLGLSSEEADLDVEYNYRSLDKITGKPFINKKSGGPPALCSTKSACYTTLSPLHLSCSCSWRCVLDEDCCSDFIEVCVSAIFSPPEKAEVDRNLNKFWCFAALGWLVLVLIAFGLVTCVEWRARVASRAKQVEKAAAEDAPDEFGGAMASERSNFMTVACLYMRFHDEETEESYCQWSQKVLVYQALYACAAFYAVGLFYEFMRHFWLLQNAQCTMMDQAEVGCLAALMVVTIGAFWAPHKWIVWVNVLIISFYAAACGAPPFTASCRDIYKMGFDFFNDSVDVSSASGNHTHVPGHSLYFLAAFVQADCEFLGRSAVLTELLWIVASPWALMRFHHMPLLLFLYMGTYVYWTSLWQVMFYPTPGRNLKHQGFRGQFMGMGVAILILLFTGMLVAYYVKYKLERGSRLRYMKWLEEREASKSIMQLLAAMMPIHVIGPMLNTPDTAIADECAAVSILFVLIDDFGAVTAHFTASQRLRFLNAQFTKFDEICDTNVVTKIETVHEEYVACVGVMPPDKDLNEKHGHGYLLERLFRVACQMQQQETPKIRYKMGMHSGPIVAGVIGTKLPRYRLFGDTMNSAARMMQKAEPGTLQFGESTYLHLSQDFQSRVENRGVVNMKGKGYVHVYAFREGSSVFDGRPPNTATIHSHVTLGSVDGDTKSDRATTSNNAVLGNAPILPIDEVGYPDEVTDEWFDEMADATGVRLTGDANDRWTPVSREKFFVWYHEEHFVHCAHRRFGKEAFTFLLITFLEVAFFITHEVYSISHRFLEGKTRLWPFVGSRLVMLMSSLMMWYATYAWSNFFLSHRTFSEFLVLFHLLLTTVLLFVSYDVLSYSLSPSVMYANARVIRYEKALHRGVEQVTVLLSIVVYLMHVHRHPFRVETMVGLLAVIAICILCQMAFEVHCLNTWPDTPVGWLPFLSLHGEMQLLIATLLCALVAYHFTEQCKARFLAHLAMSGMQSRVESILDKLMPPLVYEELRNLPPKAPKPCHEYRHATIAQSDLCGFTKLASTRTPQEVVQFMSQLFGAFDGLTDKHGVYKVETVGDAYLAGVAERPLTRINSPVAVVLFGLDMVRSVDDWAHSLGVSVTCRCGVHHGECVGGVVGTEKQRYHLFGNLLQILEIMESTSEEGRVQLSREAKEEVVNQLKDEPWASPEQLTFVIRDNIKVLQTSKGEEHSFEEVGGLTYLINSNYLLRHA